MMDNAATRSVSMSGDMPLADFDECPERATTSLLRRPSLFTFFRWCLFGSSGSYAEAGFAHIKAAPHCAHVLNIIL